MYNGAEDGDFYLYYAKCNLFLYPSIWKDNKIKTSDQKDHVHVQADGYGDIVVTDDPFQWSHSMPVKDHYCLISRVVTKSHPNPIPEVGDIDNFAKYVTEHPDIAQRNVAFVNAETPTFSKSPKYTQGSKEEKVHFLLACTECPVGSEVAFSCGAPGPDPLIDMPRTKITDPSYQSFGIKSKVPAGFESDITFSYWSNGGKPGKGFKIKISAIHVVSQGNELYARAADPVELGFPQNLLEEFGPEKAIQLGAFTAVGK